MGKIVIKWPELGLSVKCDSIDENKDAYDVLAANLPIRTVQGHEMVGGWVLRDRSVHFSKKSFDLAKQDMKEATMKELPEGTIALLSPQGTTSELLIKYSDSADDRKYVPIAKVEDADLEILKKAGKKVWQSYIRTHEVITCEIERGEE